MELHVVVGLKVEEINDRLIDMHQDLKQGIKVVKQDVEALIVCELLKPESS
jgi:hypothetical protein